MTLLKCVGQNQKHAVGFKNEKWFLNFELKDIFQRTDFIVHSCIHHEAGSVQTERDDWFPGLQDNETPQ